MQKVVFTFYKLLHTFSRTLTICMLKIEIIRYTYIALMQMLTNFTPQAFTYIQIGTNPEYEHMLYWYYISVFIIKPTSLCNINSAKPICWHNKNM